MEVREREGEPRLRIARASRSDTHSDWSTTLGANYTYQLYLQCPVSTLSIPAMYLFTSLLTVQRSSSAFPRLQGLSVQPQNRVLDLIPLFPVDGTRRMHQRRKLSPHEQRKAQTSLSPSGTLPSPRP